MNTSVSRRSGLSRFFLSADLATNRDFLKLWAGQTASLFGSAITMIALPLTAILTLHATAIEVGILSALLWLPSLLFGLVAGAWVDRVRRRPLMSAVDLGRFLLLGLIPLMAVLSILSLLSLFAIAILSATLSLFFFVAYGAYLLSLVDYDQLVEANSKLSISLSAAQVAGASLTCILIQLVTAPVDIIADSVSSLFSILFLRHGA